jgi:hypothetical protein
MFLGLLFFALIVLFVNFPVKDPLSDTSAKRVQLLGFFAELFFNGVGENFLNLLLVIVLFIDRERFYLIPALILLELTRVNYDSYRRLSPARKLVFFNLKRSDSILKRCWFLYINFFPSRFWCFVLDGF